MFSPKNHLFFLFIILTVRSYCQQPVITMLDSGRKASLRGLSVVDDTVVWASGSNGTVARSTNGGRSFEWITVKGYEQRDFRDVEAFNATTALIMAVAEPAVILKTTDGGHSWKKVFEDTIKGMFLDAMDFDQDAMHGIVVGDPVKNHFFIAVTGDGGDTWNKQTGEGLYLTDSEAFFAASGSNVKLNRFKGGNTCKVIYVSGGKSSRLYVDGKAVEIPMIQGTESTGANSIAFSDRSTAIIVGGDFAHDTSTRKNCVLVTFNKNGKSIHVRNPETPPHGYRSSVIYITKNKFVACGTSGVDISIDGGMNWTLVSTQSFHVCGKATPNGKIFLAGANGKIAVLSSF